MWWNYCDNKITLKIEVINQIFNGFTEYRVEMNIINLSPNSLIDFFVWIVVLYALVRLINLIFKVLEKYLNL